MGSDSHARQRNARGQGQLLRAEIIDAAARLLASMARPETLTLRQVAREVGIAPASIYSHFADLDALVHHVLLARYADLASTMDAAARKSRDPLEELVARCWAYATWGIEHRGEYRTLFGGALPEEIGPFAAHGAGKEILNPVVASLAGARPELESEEAIQNAGLLLWTALHGIVALYNEHGGMPWPGLDHLVAATLALHTGRNEKDLLAVVADLRGAA